MEKWEYGQLYVVYGLDEWGYVFATPTEAKRIPGEYLAVLNELGAEGWIVERFPAAAVGVLPPAPQWLVDLVTADGRARPEPADFPAGRSGPTYQDAMARRRVA